MPDVRCEVSGFFNVIGKRVEVLSTKHFMLLRLFAQHHLVAGLGVPCFPSASERSNVSPSVCPSVRPQQIDARCMSADVARSRSFKFKRYSYLTPSYLKIA